MDSEYKKAALISLSTLRDSESEEIISTMMKTVLILFVAALLMGMLLESPNRQTYTYCITALS